MDYKGKGRWDTILSIIVIVVLILPDLKMFLIYKYLLISFFFF